MGSQGSSLYSITLLKTHVESNYTFRTILWELGDMSKNQQSGEGCQPASLVCNSE